MKRQVSNNIVGNWSKSDDRLVNLSQTINMFIEQQGEGATQKSILRSINGTSSVSEFNGACRGMFVSSRTNVLYAVFGVTLYVIENDNGVIKTAEVCTVSALETPVSFIENGGETDDSNYVFLADGVNVYAVNTSSNIEAMKDTVIKFTLPFSVGKKTTIRPTHLAYLYGYLIANDQDTDAFYISYQYPLEAKLPTYESDGTVIVDEDGNIVYEDEVSKDIFQVEEGHLYYAEGDRTGFLTYSEWKPDNTTAICTNGTYLWTFGPLSTQIFNYAADVDQPFKSPTNGANGIGLKATYSLAHTGDYVFFLGSSDIGENAIWQYYNSTLTKISTTDLEREIHSLEDSADAIGQAWLSNGHLFYALTFKKAAKTFVYDVTTQAWHQRSSNDSSWRPQFATYWHNAIHFGTKDGHLVKEESNKWDEYDGTLIKKTRVGGMMVDDLSLFVVDEVRLFISTKNVNAEVFIRWKDSDNDWSSIESYWTGSDFNNRVSVWNVGMARILCFEIVSSANSMFNILGGVIKHTVIDE